MTPSDRAYEQARTIHDTIGLLKRRSATWHTMRRAIQQGQSLCQELTCAQMNCLMLVRDLGQATIKQLAEAMHVSPPSASMMVDRMVDMGILLREQRREDRREVVVRPSAKVLPEIEAAEKEFLQWIVELLTQLGPEYAEQWTNVYTRLRDLLLSGLVQEDRR